MSDLSQKKQHTDRPSAVSERVGRPKKKRLFPILALCCILLLIAMIGLNIARVADTKNLTAAYLNGNFCGYVSSPMLFPEAMEAVEKSLSGTGSVAPVRACEITYQTISTRSSFTLLTERECEELIRNEISDQYEDAYMLRINGVTVAAHEDFSVLDRVVRSVKEFLLADSGYDSVNIENVEIVRQLCAKSMLRTPDEITAILLPDRTGELNESVTFYLASLTPAEPTFFPEILEPTIMTTYQGTVEEECSIPRGTRYIEDPEHFVGIDEVIDEGSDGVERTTYGVSYDSEGNEIDRVELSRTMIVEAEDRVILQGTIPLPDTKPTGSFKWPCELLKGLSDGYGWRDLFGRADFHRGQDIPGYYRQPVYASDGGVVESAQWMTSFGNCVILSHGDTYSTLYAHLDQFVVSAGEEVYPGQLIGYMGQTGDAWGVHLHFEILINGLYVDPYPYLPNPWF